MDEREVARTGQERSALSAAGIEIRPERGPSSSRRRALKWTIRAGYGAFALAIVPPALALRALTQAVKEIAGGDLLVHASGDQTGTPVDANALQPGTSTQAFPQGKEELGNNLVQVVRLAGSGEVVAYSAICTHLGCSVLPTLNDQGWIICPCHASVFDAANGAAVVAGPAGRPLAGLPVQVAEDGTITASDGFDGDVGPG